MGKIKLKTKQIDTLSVQRFTSDAEMNAKASIGYVDGRYDAVVGTAPTDGDTLGKVNAKVSAMQTFFNGDDISFDTLKELSDGIKARVSSIDRDAANGFAGLNNLGKLSVDLFPDIMLGNVRFKGTYDGATGTITSSDASLNGQPLPASSNALTGQYFIVTSAFTLGAIGYNVGDWVLSNGLTGGWNKVDNSDAVTTVFGRNGVIVANAGDYTTAQVTETTNLYYTDARVATYSDARYSKLTGGNAFSGTQTFTGGSVSVNGGYALQLRNIGNADFVDFYNSGSGIVSMRNNNDIGLGGLNFDHNNIRDFDGNYFLKGATAYNAESVGNKSGFITSSTVAYPTVKAVMDYVGTPSAAAVPFWGASALTTAVDFNYNTATKNLSIGETVVGKMADWGNTNSVYVGNSMFMGSTYPFNGNNHLVLKTRTGGLYDIAFGSGITHATTSVKVNIKPNGNFQVGVPDTTDLGGMFGIYQPNTGYGTVSTTSGSAVVTGVNTQFNNTFKVGDLITINGETRTISVINSDSAITTSTLWSNTNSAVPYSLVGGTRFLVNGNGNLQLGPSGNNFKVLSHKNPGYVQRITVDLPNNQILLEDGNTDSGLGGGISRGNAITNVFSNYASGGGVNMTTASTYGSFQSVIAGIVVGNTSASLMSYTQPSIGPGTISTTAGSTTVTGQNTQFTNTFKVGQNIYVNGEGHTIATITNDVSLTTDAWINTNSGVSYNLGNGNGLRFRVKGNGDATITGALTTAGITSTAFGTFSTMLTTYNMTINGASYLYDNTTTTNYWTGNSYLGLYRFTSWIGSSSRDIYQVDPVTGFTFLQNIIIPAATTATQAVNKGQLDAKANLSISNNFGGNQNFMANLQVGSSASLNALLSVFQPTTGPGTVSTTAGGSTVTGSNTTFLTTFNLGDTITINGETRTINQISSNGSIGVSGATWTNTNSFIAYTLVGGTRFQVKGNGDISVPGNIFSNGLIAANITLSGGITASGTMTATGDIYTSGNLTSRGGVTRLYESPTLPNNWMWQAAGGVNYFVGFGVGNVRYDIFQTDMPTQVVTFVKNPIVPNATTAGQAVNKGQLDQKLDLAGGSLSGTLFGTNAYFTGEVGGTHVSSSYGGALTPGDASFGNVRVSANLADRRLGVMMFRNGVESWFMGTSPTDSDWRLTVDGIVPFAVNRSTKTATFIGDIEVTTNGKSIIIVDSGDGTRRRLISTNGVLSVSAAL